MLCLLLAGCATATAPPPASAGAVSEDDDFSQLVAQLRSDLSRHNKRLAESQPAVPAPRSARARDNEFAEKARALFAPLSAIHMPVVGIRPTDLNDSWGAPRDGGRRPHRGIDIFASRGTPVVAVAGGFVSYIGVQPKGGFCLWLTTETGTSFYYAHLDRWAPGLYEGMEVETGDLLGFVGNTGNAVSTPPHLHFGISQNDEMVNPYPVLTRATVVQQAQRRPNLNGGYGTR
ncbi:MAG TPA: M23 family metallopeptidase [Thermoanaerobaculia bacterium]|nr:M23 family metallopeptidase [Thermoanaerobaculia bacterium]